MATLTIADLDNGKRDLQTVSEVANSRAATATTRFGAQTTTLYEAIRRISADGEEQLDEQKTAAEEVIRSLGFRVPVEYSPGLDVTDSRFTVTGPDGKVYAPLSAPFTAGAWDPTQWYVLQNDLNDNKLLVFNSYVAASAAAATLPDGQVVIAGSSQYKVQSGALNPDTSYLLDSSIVRFQQSGGIVQSAYDILKRAFLYPEQFYLDSDGDNWAPAMQRCANAAEDYQLAVITLTPGKTYVMDDQVVIKHNSTWNCYGSKLYMRSNPNLRGGFIRAQGTGTTIGTGWTERNNIVINGMTAEIDPSVKGVNCFGTTVSHGVIHRDCVAIGATWAVPTDPKPQGGRGFSCHTRTRRAMFINCRAINCDIGYHVSDKSDTDYTLTPNLTPQFTAGVTTTGVVSSGNWLTVGDKVQLERYTGNWAALNGNIYEVVSVSGNTFTINANTTGFGAHDGLGRVSRADTGEFRSYSIEFQNCEADNCAVSAIIFEQVQQSQNIREPRSIKWSGRIKNCGTAYPSDQGVINLAGIPGVDLDIDIYQDANHPCGSVLRGVTMQSDIRIKGYVHNCTRLIEHAPLGDAGIGLETSSVLHPEGTSRANNYHFTIEADTISGYLVYSPSSQIGSTDSQNYTWRNNYKLEYSAATMPATLVHPRAQHKTNKFVLKDLSTGNETVISPTGVDGLNVRTSSNVATFRAVDPVGTSLATIRFTAANSRWLVDSGATTYFAFTPTSFQPGADNVYSIGTGALRPNIIYSASGTINTSDEREKQQWRDNSEAEKSAAIAIKRVIKAFKFSDAVNKKGEASRWHWGVGAQTIGDIMRNHGLDPAEYAFWCYDEWAAQPAVVDDDGNVIEPSRDAGGRYGIRYDELTMFILASL